MVSHTYLTGQKSFVNGAQHQALRAVDEILSGSELLPNCDSED